MARFGKKTEEDAISEAYGQDETPAPTTADDVMENPYSPPDWDTPAEDTTDTERQDPDAWTANQEGTTEMTATATETPAETETPAVLNDVTSESKPKRGRPSLAQLPELTTDGILVDEDVPEDEWAQMPAGPTPVERSAVQIDMDERVRKVHNAWIEAGKPKVATSPRKRLTVKPELDATARGMLTRAGAFLKVKVIVIQKVHNSDGTVSIVYTVHDRPAPKKTEKK